MGEKTKRTKKTNKKTPKKNSLMHAAADLSQGIYSEITNVFVSALEETPTIDYSFREK